MTNASNPVVAAGNGIRESDSTWSQEARLIVADSEELTNTFVKINQWGIDRGITRENRANALSQIVKLRKEINELEAGIIAGDDNEAVDGIGDPIVVLIQIARLMQVSLNEAMNQAYNDIKDRKGQMCCGIFVKEKSIELLKANGLELSSFETPEALEDTLENLTNAAK